MVTTAGLTCAESEDQACLNLIMYALTNACQAKLHLRQLQTCTTLCNFLIGKATGVLSLRRLLDRLLAIRNQSDADLVRGDDGVKVHESRSQLPSTSKQRRLAPAMHMPNDVAPAADLLPGAAEGPMRVPGNVADNMLAEQQEDEEDAQSDDDETGFIDMDHYPPSTSHMSTTYM